MLAVRNEPKWFLVYCLVGSVLGLGYGIYYLRFKLLAPGPWWAHGAEPDSPIMARAIGAVLVLFFSVALVVTVRALLFPKR